MHPSETIGLTDKSEADSSDFYKESNQDNISKA